MKDEIIQEVLGFYRQRCSEMLSVIESGMKHFPPEDKALAELFVASTKKGLATAQSVIESLGPIPGYDDLADDEWFDSTGRPCVYGAFDADGHYHAERDQGVDRDCD